MRALPRTTLVLLTLCCVARFAEADPPARPFVRDNAELFRDATRVRADEEIREIRRLFHRDVVVETMASLPAGERGRVRSMRRPQQASYFAALGRQHAQEFEVDGIFILICRDPSYIQVTVWPESQQQTFGEDDAERLHKFLKRRTLFGRFDQALLDGLALVKDTYRRNLHLNHPDEGLATAGSLAVMVLGFLGVWLLLILANSRQGAEPTAALSGPHPGLLGTMFGQSAALWIYDRLFPIAPVADGSAAPAPLPATTFVVPMGQSAATRSDGRVATSAQSASSSSLPSG